MTPWSVKYCTNCGWAAYDADAFCMSCGRPFPSPQVIRGGRGGATHTSNVPPHKEVESHAARNVSIIVILVVVGLVGIVALAGFTYGLYSGPSYGHPTYYAEAFVSGVVDVGPGNYSYFSVNVPSGASNLTILGWFSTGAISQGVTVEVYVMNAFDFYSWKSYSGSNVELSTHYDSGKVSNGTLLVEVPPAPIYYVVISNVYDSTSSKTVQAVIDLNYEILGTR